MPYEICACKNTYFKGIVSILNKGVSEKRKKDLGIKSFKK